MSLARPESGSPENDPTLPDAESIPSGLTPTGSDAPTLLFDITDDDPEARG